MARALEHEERQQEQLQRWRQEPPPGAVPVVEPARLMRKSVAAMLSQAALEEPWKRSLVERSWTIRKHFIKSSRWNGNL